MDEFAGQVRDYTNRLPDDESALEEIAARITQLQQLKRKYGEDLADILAYAEKARLELLDLEQMDEKIAGLSTRSTKLEHELVLAADDVVQVVVQRRSLDGRSRPPQYEFRVLILVRQAAGEPRLGRRAQSDAPPPLPPPLPPRVQLL